MATKKNVKSEAKLVVCIFRMDQFKFWNSEEDRDIKRMWLVIQKVSLSFSLQRSKEFRGSFEIKLLGSRFGRGELDKEKKQKSLQFQTWVFERRKTTVRKNDILQRIISALDHIAICFPRNVILLFSI